MSIASLEPYKFDRSADSTISTEQDAIHAGLAKRAFFFQTYEESSVVIEGKLFESKPDNYSGRRYLGVGKVYSAADVLASYQRDLEAEQEKSKKGGSHAFNAQFAIDAIQGVMNAYRGHPAGQAYIPEPGSHGDFIKLEAKDKAFDSSGREIWPAGASRPAPQPQP